MICSRGEHLAPANFNGGAIMHNCKYCTNYFMNTHIGVDNSCMGHNDCRKPYFSCNEKLNPEYDDTQDMIQELKKRGYECISKKNNKSQ